MSRSPSVSKSWSTSACSLAWYSGCRASSYVIQVIVCAVVSCPANRISIMFPFPTEKEKKDDFWWQQTNRTHTQVHTQVHTHARTRLADCAVCKIQRKHQERDNGKCAAAWPAKISIRGNIFRGNIFRGIFRGNILTKKNPLKGG